MRTWPPGAAPLSTSRTSEIRTSLRSSASSSICSSSSRVRSGARSSRVREGEVVGSPRWIRMSLRSRCLVRCERMPGCLTTVSPWIRMSTGSSRLSWRPQSPEDGRGHVAETGGRRGGEERLGLPVELGRRRMPNRVYAGQPRDQVAAAEHRFDHVVRHSDREQLRAVQPAILMTGDHRHLLVPAALDPDKIPHPQDPDVAWELVLL